jgi:uncharacterized cupin superfamily protein
MHTPTPAEIAATDLRPDAIPEPWVHAGAPHARSAELWRSRDGRETVFLWACDPCEYEWRFESDETARILEGEVEVDDGSGPRTLRPGDEASFVAGSVARWRAPNGLKKLSFCRDRRPRPSVLARALRKLGFARLPDAAV